MMTRYGGQDMPGGKTRAQWDKQQKEIERLRAALEKIRDELDGPEYGAYAVWAAGIAREALRESSDD